MSDEHVPRNVVDRLRLEWRVEDVEGRLEKGAVAFGEIRHRLDDVAKRIDDATRPKPVPIIKVIGIAATLALIVGGWVWHMARYPDRSEFDSVRRDHAATVRALEDSVGVLRSQQVRMQADLEAIRGLLDRQETVLRDLAARRR